MIFRSISFLKYSLFLLCGMMFFCSSTTFSQTIAAQKLIEGLQSTAVDQTQKFGDLSGDMLLNFNEDAFNLQVKATQAYLRKNTDDRLKIRMFMYERFAYQKMNKPDTLNTAVHYFKMIKLASQLGDEQLLSDLYSKYAVLCAPSQKLYYLLKCIEIRERIGLAHFSDISANYYWASELLYQITDYKSSATYAARAAALFNKKDQDGFLFHYVLALDLAGASYLKINKPDSAIYYYNYIGKLIDDRITQPNKFTEVMNLQTLQIWQGVVKGGIAKAYMLQKKYNAAYPLLLQNLKSSSYFKQWDNVAEVQNTLAGLDELRHHTALAISRYSQAYELASKGTKLAALATAAAGLSSAFAVKHQYDSAYVYHKRYLLWKDKIDQEVNESHLDMVKTQVAFERMQKELLQSKNNLVNQKRVRNSILVTIVFLTLIALLLYKRKRLQMSLQNEKLEKEKQKSEAEIVFAQQQIDFFVKNIAEKNNLVEQLQGQLTMRENVKVNTALNHFTILTEEDWQKFKTNFEIVNPGFLYRLKQKMPQITPGEQRVMVLAKLGFSTKEMANATGVSSETIRSVISRMRKKFNLDTAIATIANEI